MICDDKKMVTYIELQYPVISLNRGKLLPPFIRKLLLQSCSVNGDIGVVAKRHDFANEPYVFYIMVDDEVHGECSVELDGLVTYKIADGFEMQVDGMIKVNLVHSISYFLKLDTLSAKMTKRIVKYLITGIIFAITFVLATLFEVSGIVEGIILGLSVSGFMCAYFTFAKVKKMIAIGRCDV